MKRFRLVVKSAVVMISMWASCSLFSCNRSSETREGTSDTIEVGNVDTDTLTNIDSVRDTLDSAGRAIKADADSLAAAGKAKAQSTGEAIKEDFNAAKEDVTDAAKAAGKDIKKAANKVADETKEGYNDVKNKLKRDTTKK